MAYQDSEARGRRLPDGSLLLTEEELLLDLMEAAGAEIEKLEAERDRARRLAVKLEEVVAARTAVLEEFVGWWPASPTTHDQNKLIELLTWAKVQLEEIP